MTARYTQRKPSAVSGAPPELIGRSALRSAACPGTRPSFWQASMKPGDVPREVTQRQLRARRQAVR
ncbi:MAG: hypothetical protein ABR926_26460 [Streptosporangiaceae bacterium]